MTARYFSILFATAAAIAAFPLTMRGNDNAVRTNHDTVISSRNVPVFTDRVATTESRNYRIFRVTAYCQNECCCSGSADGITASGHRITAKDYGTTAAGPREYPFGTRFEIQGYGVVTCRDRGGKIKTAGTRITGADRKTYTLDHDRIDILMKDHQTAKDFGIQYLPVTVITAEK